MANACWLYRATKTAVALIYKLLGKEKKGGRDEGERVEKRTPKGIAKGKKEGDRNKSNLVESSNHKEIKDCEGEKGETETRAAMKLFSYI